jgi:carbonic anhydrase/acetyltransferase-like protein (isoleucine patch superfamily)
VSGYNLFPYAGKMPKVHESAFIAPGCQIIGDVEIGAQASIWFNCVIRGDVNSVRIGARTNIQDGTVIHCDSDFDGRGGYPTLIGDDALVGHMAMIHGCTIEDHGFVGLGAVVMNGCVVEHGGMLAAGGLMTPGKRLPAGQLWAGRPARFLRDLTAEEISSNWANVAHYAENGQNYRRVLG